LLIFVFVALEKIWRVFMHSFSKSRTALALLAAIGLGGAAGTAFAQSSQELNVRSLAATCANCHGTNGKAVEGSAVVSLAGVPKDYIIAQMVAFKSGARPATIMHQISKGYSDAQVEQIAGYFAAQKK
jgi:cytochrome subunit of sulfide dehydrogenase